MRLINPIIPGEYRYPTITPFTIPDGHTYLKTLEWLIQRMKQIIDEIDENNVELLDTVVATLNSKIEEINTAFAEFEGEVDDKLSAVDTKISELETFVNAEVSELETFVNTKIGSLEGFVNDSVQQIINNSIEVQDSVVAGIVDDTESDTRVALDNLYLPLSDVNVIDTVNSYVINVLDYGVDNTGATSQAGVLQTIFDTAEGKTVYFPPGEYLVNGVVHLPGDVTIVGQDATIVKTAGSQVVFTALGGYGWIENISIRNLNFRGNFPSNGVMVLWAHRARNINITNVNVEQAVTHGHCFDLMGCDNVVITDCEFAGAVPVTGSEWTEAIQLDASTIIGTPIPVDSPIMSSRPQHFTGDATQNVTVTRCRFVKWGEYNAPVAIGSHAAVENRPYRNITFVNNCVETPNLGSTYRSIIHFVYCENVEVTANYFNVDPGFTGYGIVSHEVSRWLKLVDVNEASASFVDVPTPFYPRTVAVYANTGLDGLDSVSSYALGVAPVLPLESGFTPYSGGTPLRTRVTNGVVTISGIVSTEDIDGIKDFAGKLVTTLPWELRPWSQIRVLCPASFGETFILSIHNDGGVFIERYDGNATKPYLQVHVTYTAK